MLAAMRVVETEETMAVWKVEKKADKMEIEMVAAKVVQ